MKTRVSVATFSRILEMKQLLQHFCDVQWRLPLAMLFWEDWVKTPSLVESPGSRKFDHFLEGCLFCSQITVFKYKHVRFIGWIIEVHTSKLSYSTKHLRLKDFKSLNDGSKLTLTYMLWRCYLRHFTDNPPSLIEVVMINIDCESWHNFVLGITTRSLLLMRITNHNTYIHTCTYI